MRLNVTQTLQEEFLSKASEKQLKRIASAAHWYAIVVIDGCRRDTAWFELEEAVADVMPVRQDPGTHPEP